MPHALAASKESHPAREKSTGSSARRQRPQSAAHNHQDFPGNRRVQQSIRRVGAPPSQSPPSPLMQSQSPPAPSIVASVMPGAIQRTCACGGGGGPSCGCNEEDYKLPPIRRKAADYAAVPSRSVVSAALSLPRRGRQLEASQRAFMEPRFGRDFAGVRIHTDGASADAAKMLHASAFTTGQDIHFAEGAYRPNTDGGRRLLAHELTHTVQQRTEGRASIVSPDSRALSRPGDAGEREADQVAQRIVGDSPVPDIHSSAAGVQRQTHDDGPSDAGAPAGAPAPIPIAGQAGGGNSGAGSEMSPPDVAPLTPATAGATLEAADPCDVEVDSLTNAELMSQYVASVNYVRSHFRMDDYYAQMHLLRRLLAERRSRMRGGDVWLGDDIAEVPSTLYQLTSGNSGGIVVNRIGGAVVSGVPKSSSDATVLTGAQFTQFLNSHGIPTMSFDMYMALANGASSFEISPDAAPGETGDSRMPPAVSYRDNDIWPAATGAGVAGSSLYASPFATYSLPYIAKPLTSTSSIGQGNNWRGKLGEVSHGYPSILGSWPYQDLNTITSPRDFMVLDSRNRVNNLVFSDKTSMGTTTDAPRRETYMDGWNDLNGVPRRKAAVPTQFNQAVADLNAAGISITGPDLIVRGRLTVNEDHVSTVQDWVRKATSNPKNFGAYQRMYDAYLADQPIRVAGTTCDSWAKLQGFRSSHAAEFDAAVGELAERAASRVVTNGITTAQLRNLQRFRARYPNVSEAEFNRLASPELIEMERYGGGYEGGAIAMENAGMRGGAGGLMLGGAMEGAGLIRHWARGDEINNATLIRSGINVGMAGVGGFTAATIETGIKGSMSRGFLDAAGAEGMVGAGAPLILRGIGGGVAGSIAAPLVVMGQMGFDPEHSYAGVDYASRATRAFVVGGISGAAGAGAGFLAAGGAGAAVGSVEPGGGTVVGFIVGILAYLVTDLLIGDEIEDWTRDLIGEPQGCPRPEQNHEYVPPEAQTNYDFWEGPGYLQDH